MKITFTAEPMEKPEGMNLKAELAWSYFQFNRGCWQAAECGDGTIIIADESADLCTAQAFPDLSTFVEWLTDTADEMLTDDAANFLMGSSAIDPSLLWDDVREAILRHLNADDRPGGENA